MFQNLEITIRLGSPICAIDNILLDSLLSFCVVRDMLGEDYFIQASQNKVGTKEEIDEMLGQILDKKNGVYCASAAIGNHREFVSHWSKRWASKYDDLVREEKRKKHRVDIGAGHFKGYRMPVVLKAVNKIKFYARGDKNKIEHLLNSYLFFIGKKRSQGYGEIKNIDIKVIEQDYSLCKDNEIMRPIPVKYAEEYAEMLMKKQIYINMKEHAVIPPYWRNDNRESCLMPTHKEMI